MSSSSQAVAGTSSSRAGRCMYSRRECTRPRYLTYKYCMHHILEDSQAPFTSCEYISQITGRKCPNPAPRPQKQTSDPVFCSEHLHDLIVKEKHQKQKKRLRRKRKGDKSSETSAADLKRRKLINRLYKYTKNGEKVPEEVVDESTDSETEEVHRPVKDDWLLEDTLDISTNADWDDFDLVNNEVYEPLRYADVLTPEEVVATAQSKLIRLQSLYIEQFKRLFHLLKESRRKYLHDRKKEMKEEKGAAGASRKYLDEEEDEKIRALAMYRKRTGTEALLRKRQLQNRLQFDENMSNLAGKSTTTQRCGHISNHTRCNGLCLPYTKYCSSHILEDPHQQLYKKCHTEECPVPVCHLVARPYEITNDDSTTKDVYYCLIHAPLPPMTFTFPDLDSLHESISGNKTSNATAGTKVNVADGRNDQDVKNPQPTPSTDVAGGSDNPADVNTPVNKEGAIVDKMEVDADPLHEREFASIPVEAEINVTAEIDEDEPRNSTTERPSVSYPVPTEIHATAEVREGQPTNITTERRPVTIPIQAEVHAPAYSDEDALTNITAENQQVSIPVQAEIHATAELKADPPTNITTERRSVGIPVRADVHATAYSDGHTPTNIIAEIRSTAELKEEPSTNITTERQPVSIPVQADVHATAYPDGDTPTDVSSEHQPVSIPVQAEIHATADDPSTNITAKKDESSIKSTDLTTNRTDHSAIVGGCENDITDNSSYAVMDRTSVRDSYQSIDGRNTALKNVSPKMDESSPIPSNENVSEFRNEKCSGESPDTSVGKTKSDDEIQGTKSVGETRSEKRSNETSDKSVAITKTADEIHVTTGMQVDKSVSEICTNSTEITQPCQHTEVLNPSVDPGSDKLRHGKNYSEATLSEPNVRLITSDIKKQAEKQPKMSAVSIKKRTPTTYVKPSNESTNETILGESPKSIPAYMCDRGERKPSSAEEQLAVVSLLQLHTGVASDENTSSSAAETE